MFNPFVIPAAAFAFAAVMVAIVSLAKLHDKETEVHYKLHQEQLEHQRKMKELEMELARLRPGS